MKEWKRFSLLLVLAVLMTGCDGGDRAELADGSRVAFDRWDGRWLIVNYWAEWCAPCRKEIPELNLLHAERSGTDVVVLGVNYDGLRGDKLAGLVKEMGIEFPVLVDDPRLRWGADLPAVLPTTLIIDPEGQLSNVLVGPQHYEDFLRAIGQAGAGPEASTGSGTP